MVICAEASELHLLGVFDLLRVAVAPFDRHFRVCVRIYEHIECAIPIENRKEGHGGGDLSEDGLDFVLDLFLGFLDRFGGRCGRITVARIVSCGYLTSEHGR